MATLDEQLDSLLKLGPNWDGYNADAIQPRLVALARDFVQFFQALETVNSVNMQIFVHPTRVGGVQIEWLDGKFEHELELNPDGSIGMLHIDRFTGQMTEETFQPPTEPSAVAPGLLDYPGLLGRLVSSSEF